MRCISCSGSAILALCALTTGCGQASPTTAPQEVPDVLKKLEEAKRAKAQVDVRVLTQALQVFKLNHSRYPESLEELAKSVDGTKPGIEADKLIDPWKARYQSDPAGPKNKGERPDVWTTAPDGSVIGNWPEKK
jgi:hypothetical protein